MQYKGIDLQSLANFSLEVLRMSFNVTQCPACESTFNTNSRVLAAAAGKVRCGACLNIFEAIDNFLIPEEADAAPDQDESVFVGNDPQAFFDPSSFLTRSALSEDSFVTMARERQGRAEAPALENSYDDEDPSIDQPELLQASIANDKINKEFEDKILDSFVAQVTDVHELTKHYSADSSLEEPIDRKPEPELTDSEETHIESRQPFLGIGLSASFTFDPNAPPQVRIATPKAESPPDQEAAIEQPVDQSSTSGYESFGAIENLTQEEKPAPDVLTPRDSVWSPISDKMTAPLSNEEATQFFATEKEKEESITESLPTAGSSALSEPIAPVTDNENLDVDSKPPSQEIDDIQNLAKQEKLGSESVGKDEGPTIEATQTSDRVIDEDSAQAIRARVLEAELSDEEALEAIPRENLTALGSMSTPVELLARKESRLLRSALLFLSILLLGGLLSSQYLWQRMELYSQLPQLRPLYEVACIYLNCALPQYADIDSIRSENLTVQTHPTLANGLMVNTVIRNSAEFEQPFPILVLSFNSVENSVIALREFTSAEYLDPGLRSTQAMPANTPVQIRLAIMDPGPEAVNYTLAFRWP